MAIDKEILKNRLAEAEEAYHHLMIGAREVMLAILVLLLTIRPVEQIWKPILQTLNRKLPRRREKTPFAAKL